MAVNIYEMADTWNDVNTTYTAIKMNVTDTTSSSGSMLIDLQVGSSSKFKVVKDGDAEFAGAITAKNVLNPFLLLGV